MIRRMTEKTNNGTDMMVGNKDDSPLSDML